MKTKILLISLFVFSNLTFSQTLYVPNRTIGSSTSGIGIGCSTPFSRVSLGSISSNIDNRIALFENTATAPGKYFYGIGMANPASGVYGLGLYGGTNDNYPSNTNMHIFIKNNGSVGIGTADPLATLHINGNQLIHMTTNVNLKISNWELAGPNTVALAAGQDASSSHIPIAFAASKFYFHSGYVGIGCSNPTAPLTVNGKILATEIEVVNPVPCSDYVFEESYKPMTISSLEKYVKTNKHLPEVPSAKEFKENGYNLAEMDNVLLKKVEELTLYTIEQNKKLEQQEIEINNLKLLVSNLLNNK